MSNLKTVLNKSKIRKISANEVGNYIRLVCIDDPSLMFNDLLLAKEITATYGILCTSKDVQEYFKLHDQAEQTV